MHHCTMLVPVCYCLIYRQYCLCYQSWSRLFSVSRRVTRRSQCTIAPLCYTFLQYVTRRSQCTIAPCLCYQSWSRLFSVSRHITRRSQCTIAPPGTSQPVSGLCGKHEKTMAECKQWRNKVHTLSKNTTKANTKILEKET